IESLMSLKIKTLKNENAKISTKTLTESFLKEYDEIYSGFGRGKKFPEAAKISLMMDLSILDDNKELGVKSLEMLDVMALRGLYDHIGGGFFRYTVDAAWEIPHFEKMLYNQAELIPLYIKAYQWSKKELYKDIVVETIEMLDKRFLKNNLYYSASDADTNHKEGAFFTFEKEKVKNALLNNPHAKLIKELLEFSINGNFQGKVHLNFYTSSRPKGFKKFKKELQKIRKKKEFPFIDKKINTAWNAMMIEALFKASVIDKNYTKKANTHLDALKEFMFDRGELYHQSLIGLKPVQLGLLEDYSFFISALLSGYEVDFDESKLDFAEYLLNRAKSKFYKDGMWLLSDDELKIKADMNDKYYTSPLAKMTQNIIKLASLKSSFKYDKLARETLETMNANIEKSQSNTPAAAKAFLMQTLGVVTLKSSSENLEKERKNITKTTYPFILLKVQKNDKFLACTMRSCFSIDKDYKVVKKIIEKGEWKD
ncbi:MAG: thioredoxin domain-containing protein, partial [Sulfurimonas sp.]|nr:thioredoxin domain-containing protein [Sulfurimonas sp.]